jgi:endoglucanase
LLKRLTEAHGIPGQEDAIRVIVSDELKSLGDLTTDAMGNLIFHRAGKPGAKKLMLAAHMDEIGFAVRFVDPKGFLRIHPLGGWDPRMMCAQRVKVTTRKSGVLNGVLMPSVKPKHMLGNDAPKPLTTEDFFVDCGLSGDEAKEKVEIGDMVTMDRGFQQMGDLFTCKAMDDRLAVFVMIEAVKKAAKHDVELFAVATVQEEIGLRGAAASGWGIQPDLVVALDVTLANDIPGLPDDLAVTRLGEGTAIKFLDSSLICHPKMFRHFRDIAEKKKINHQIELLPAGGTDAGGIQRLHGGIPAFTLSIPTRYIHTVNETVHKDDVQASIDLLAAYIEECNGADYTL